MSDNSESNLSSNLTSRAEPVLSVKGLTASYQIGKNWQEVIRDIDLEIFPGDTYGVVGESGSGKTTLALAIMGYLGDNGRIDRGEINLDGQDICSLSPMELRQIWGHKLSFVPQDPSASLNPSLRIEKQMGELLQHQLGISSNEAEERSIALLESVQIVAPDRVLNSYPHQISGGMKQRVLIAMALSTEPDLLIFDEPTTGLDVTTQAAVLDLIRELVASRQTAVMYVSHNLGVIGALCDRVAVLYAGELFEDASVNQLFSNALHPYTIGLLESIPRLSQASKDQRFSAMEGAIPPLDGRPTGCVFEPRCPVAIEICKERPQLFDPGLLRKVRCHRWEEIAQGEIDPSPPRPEGPPQVGSTSAEAVLELRQLSVPFPISRTLREIITRSPQRSVTAVRDVDLKVTRGETIGLVGESGSGKTSLARAVAGLIVTTKGQIEVLTIPIPQTINQRDLDTLRKLQMVFQNPDEALNPYLSIGESLGRPLVTLLQKSKSDTDILVFNLLEAVKLPASYKDRYPDQLSGGEKQRVAIARAFASNPDLLLFDEPVSSLDVSVQASVLNLLSDLQDQNQTSQLFISHDLTVVAAVSDQIAVIYLGEIMEFSPARSLFQPPNHPYTEALLSAVPRIDRRVPRGKVRIKGEIPQTFEGLKGCPFHSRCPRSLGELCEQEAPPWQKGPSGKRIFCHIPIEDLEIAQAKDANDLEGETWQDI